MSATENKEFVRKYLEDINKKPKTLELLQKYITDQTLIDHILASEIAFPLYWVEVEEEIAEGDLVSIRASVRGFHGGPFMDVPATGKEIDVPFYVTYLIKDGKIADHWMTMDSAIMLQQLGISQPEKPAA